jgi:DNA-binding response OmpR family regulator
VNVTKVLIINDEQEHAEIIAHGLERRGIEVDMTDLDRRAVQLCTDYTYNLVMIDMNDQFSEILALCQRIRAAFDGPLLVLTYESDERLHLQLYRAGINESIAKPIGIPLLLAKVRAWLHRALVPQPQPSSIQYADFQLDTINRTLTRPDKKEVKLSNLEYRLAFLLLTNRGQLLATESLVDRMWSEHGDGDSSMLKNVIYRLRRKIEPDSNLPPYIETVAGHGYRFRSDR